MTWQRLKESWRKYSDWRQTEAAVCSHLIAITCLIASVSSFYKITQLPTCQWQEIRERCSSSWHTCIKTQPRIYFLLHNHLLRRYMPFKGHLLTDMLELINHHYWNWRIQYRKDCLFSLLLSSALGEASAQKEHSFASLPLFVKHEFTREWWLFR